MEKLIIEYYNTYETEKEKDEYTEALSKLMFKENGNSGEELTKLIEDYESNHTVKSTREYPETLFNKMSNMKELYEFIRNDIGSCSNLKALQTPKNLDKLKYWIPWYLKESDKGTQKLKANVFSFYSDWLHQKETDNFFKKLSDEQIKFLIKDFPDKIG